MKYCLAIDIGASSGRHIVGWKEDGELRTREVYRFKNGVSEVEGHLVWDIDHLVEEVKNGIEAARNIYKLESLSIEELEHNTGHTYQQLYIVGGGTKNRFLNRLTEEATGKKVIALPIEATALGNLNIQVNE